MPGSKRTGTRIHRWFSRPFAHAESTHSKRTLSFYILLLLLGRVEGRAPIQSRKQKESLSFEKSRWNVSFHSFFKLGRRAVVTNRRTEIKSLRSGEGGLFYCWDFLLLLLLLLFCSKRPIGFSSWGILFTPRFNRQKNSSILSRSFQIESEAHRNRSQTTKR